MAHDDAKNPSAKHIINPQTPRLQCRSSAGAQTLSRRCWLAGGDQPRSEFFRMVMYDGQGQWIGLHSLDMGRSGPLALSIVHNHTKKFAAGLIATCQPT